MDTLHGQRRSWEMTLTLSFLNILGYDTCHLNEATLQLVWAEAKTSEKLTEEGKSLPPLYLCAAPTLSLQDSSSAPT